MSTPAEQFLEALHADTHALAESFDEVFKRRRKLQSISEHDLKLNLIALRMDPDEAATTARTIYNGISTTFRAVGEAATEADVLSSGVGHAVSSVEEIRRQRHRAGLR